MRIRDEEDILRAVHLFVRENLNTKIAAINAQKGDSIVLDTFPDEDRFYVFSATLSDLPNNPFVNFSVLNDIPVINNYNDRISIPQIMVEVAFDDKGREDTYFRSMRYMRALMETILDFTSIDISQMQMSQMFPILVVSDRRKLVVSGVQFSMDIG